MCWKRGLMHICHLWFDAWLITCHQPVLLICSFPISVNNSALPCERSSFGKQGPLKSRRVSQKSDTPFFFLLSFAYRFLSIFTTHADPLPPRYKNILQATARQVDKIVILLVHTHTHRLVLKYSYYLHWEEDDWSASSEGQSQTLFHIWFNCLPSDIHIHQWP